VRVVRVPGGTCTVRFAVFEMPPLEAVREAVVVALTKLVLTVKVAVVAPAWTSTDAGTVTELLLLESVTDVPVEGAAAVSVTVPVALAPPLTLAGLTEIDDNAAADVPLVVTATTLLGPVPAGANGSYAWTR
jgi:hypothetical protein